jgi:hypothetical protein
MKFSMFVTAALLMGSGSIQAKDFSGAVTLGYANISASDGGGKFSSPTLDGRVRANFENFSLGGRLDVLGPEGSGGTGSLIGIDGAIGSQTTCALAAMLNGHRSRVPVVLYRQPRMV